MPKGVYPRTPNQLRAAVDNLAKGRQPQAREKAAATLRKLAQTEEWKERVSQKTKEGMSRPEAQEKYRSAMAAVKSDVPNFRGGNGQEPVAAVLELAAMLEPDGYIREFPIKTRGHGTEHNVPTCYKADFANPDKRIVIELDGPSHKGLPRQQLDRKKTEVLEALGWEVHRLTHR